MTDDKKPVAKVPAKPVVVAKPALRPQPSKGPQAGGGRRNLIRFAAKGWCSNGGLGRHAVEASTRGSGEVSLEVAGNGLQDRAVA